MIDKRGNDECFIKIMAAQTQRGLQGNMTKKETIKSILLWLACTNLFNAHTRVKLT